MASDRLRLPDVTASSRPPDGWLAEQEQSLLESWAEQLAVINKVTRAVNSSLNIEEIYRTVGSEVRRLVAFDRLSLALVEEGDRFVQIFGIGEGEDAQESQVMRVPVSGRAVEWVIKTRQPLLSDDLTQDPRFERKEFLLGEGIRAYLSLPLIAKGRVIGAFNIGSKKAGFFSERYVAALVQIAGQVAVAIENARLFETERKRARHLAILNETAKQAMSSLHLDELLKNVARAIQRDLTYFDVSLFLTDPKAGEVALVAQAGAYAEPPPLGYRQKIGVGMVGWVARYGETLLANDVSKEPRRIVAFTGEAGSKSELCVPIRIGKDTVGVINVESQQLNAFDSMDVTALETLSELLARAIENSRLYGDMRLLKELNEGMVAAIPSVLLMVDADMNIISANRTSGALMGRTASELAGANLRSVFSDRLISSSGLAQAVKTATATGQQVSLPDVRDILPSGAERIFDIRVARASAPEGPRALVILDDITAQRRAQEEIAKERQKLNDVVSAMGAGLALISPDLRLLWANKTLVDWFGQPQSSHMSCYAYYRERAQPCENCPSMRALKSGRNETEENVLPTKDGGQRHFFHVVAPIRDDRGNIVQLLKLTQDVTEQARQVSRLSTLYQLSHDMEHTLDLDRLLHAILTGATAGPGLGFNRAVLLRVNEADGMLEGRMAVGPTSLEDARRIWGEMSKAPKSFTDLLAECDKIPDKTALPLYPLARQMRVSMKDEKHIVLSCLLQKQPTVVSDAANDPRVPEEFRRVYGAREFIVVPLIARDKAIGVLIADKVYSGQPITQGDVHMLSLLAGRAGLAIENAEAYERLGEQNVQLREAMSREQETRERLLRSERLAVIGNMAAHVAHEIRNPLATIGGFARSVLKDPENAPRTARNARIILEEVERLEHILRNVMDFARPSRPVFKEVDLNEVLRGLCAFMEAEFAKRTIRLVLDLGNGLPSVWLDPAQMRQVFINLIQNGLESMGSGGTLTVMTSQSNGSVTVEVADTGRGIAPEEMERLFQPFFTTKPGGTGLGLAVSQKIVNDHGGDLTVESQKGRGARFRVLLPVKRPEATGEGPKDAGDGT